MDNKEILYDLVKEVLEEQKQQNKSLTKIEVSFAKMEANIEKNTEDLAHHIKRTDALQELHESNEARIQKLEQPISVKDLATKAAIIFGAVGAVVSAIYELLHFFNILK